MKLKSKSLMLGIVLVGCGLAADVFAANLQAVVRDNRENLLEEAVVFARPIGGLTMEEQQRNMRIIEQIDKEFVPIVSVFQEGTQVEFPNHDEIRHHVYSFSEAKTFEIPLYRGKPAEPVLFDQAGEVTLGCNIHDWMVAYILVTDTPYFAKTDASGKADLSGLPPGEYTVEAWHFEQANPVSDSAVTVTLAEGETATLQFQIERKKIWVPFRAPVQSQDSY